MYVFSRVDSWNSLWTERQRPLVSFGVGKFPPAPPKKTMPEINTEINMPGVWYCCRRTSTGSTACDADCPFPAASAIFAGSIGGACFHGDRRRLQTADQSTPEADLRSGHLCSGRRGPCHMVLGGPWWKSIKNWHYSCQNRIFVHHAFVPRLNVLLDWNLKKCFKDVLF